MAFQSITRHARQQLLIRVLVLGMMAGICLPAHAFWGLLGKVGSAGGKAAATAGKTAAGTAGKGAAAGGAAVAGAEAANTGAQAAKAGAGLAAQSGDDIARASGLGKAVPDEVSAMLHTPGKTLADISDPGTRSWLSLPPGQLHASDAPLMVTDYARLLEGKPAKGPKAADTTQQAANVPPARLPTSTPPSQVPWQAIELLLHAARMGHQGTQSEWKRLCASQPVPDALAGRCPPPGHAKAPAPRKQ
ncbi:MAG: hypothetical protein Q4G70_12310 [Pseudomonadota bacterium]|nr:hypothetical protein [Pseudomonadota bacterium]